MVLITTKILVLIGIPKKKLIQKEFLNGNKPYKGQ